MEDFFSILFLEQDILEKWKVFLEQNTEMILIIHSGKKLMLLLVLALNCMMQVGNALYNLYVFSFQIQVNHRRCVYFLLHLYDLYVYTSKIRFWKIFCQMIWNRVTFFEASHTKYSCLSCVLFLCHMQTFCIVL